MEKEENSKSKNILENEKNTKKRNISKKENIARNRKGVKKRNKAKSRNIFQKRNILKEKIEKRKKKSSKESMLKKEDSKKRNTSSKRNLSSKGKHAKKRKLKINPKAFTIRIVILMIIIIGVVIYNINIKVNKNKEETQNPEMANQQIEETVQASSVEEEVIEETVDTKVEQLINEICTQNNLNENNFHFFYYNIEEKKYYFYNEDTYFTAASTIKVPVSMLYYDKIAEGELTLEDTLLYNKGDYEAGGGTTAAYYSVGERVPLSHLLEQTIVNSDNTALNILIGNIGYRKCKEELTKYSDIELPEDFYTSNVASGSYYYDVLQYLYQNSDKYSGLIEYMKKSSGGEYLKAKLPQYDVAHKYGSYNGYVHDYGIVYGKNTYLIGVFTKGVADASKLIADIGEKVVNCVEGDEEIGETNTEIDIVTYTQTNTSNETN